MIREYYENWRDLDGIEINYRAKVGDRLVKINSNIFYTCGEVLTVSSVLDEGLSFVCTNDLIPESPWSVCKSFAMLPDDAHTEFKEILG
jgi:hypothetical protein